MRAVMKGQLYFRRRDKEMVAVLAISDTVMFTSTSVSKISEEIKRRGISEIHLESGISFAVPTDGETLAYVAKHPSQNDFFIFRLICECSAE